MFNDLVYVSVLLRGTRSAQTETVLNDEAEVLERLRCSSDPVLCVLGRDQELKVFQARRSLEEALTADGLARAAENSRELLQGKTA